MILKRAHKFANYLFSGGLISILWMFIGLYFGSVFSQDLYKELKYSMKGIEVEGIVVSTVERTDFKIKPGRTIKNTNFIGTVKFIGRDGFLYYFEGLVPKSGKHLNINSARVDYKFYPYTTRVIYLPTDPERTARVGSRPKITIGDWLQPICWTGLCFTISLIVRRVSTRGR